MYCVACATTFSLRRSMFVICGNYSFHVKTIYDKNLGDAVLVVMCAQTLKKIGETMHVTPVQGI